MSMSEGNSIMKIDRTTVLVSAIHSAWYAYTVLGLGEQGEPMATAPKWQKKSISEAIDFWDTKMKELNLENKAENDVVQILSPLTHANWCDHKLKEGWTYGLVKDSEDKTHPCLVQYAELPEAQKKKDEVVIRTYLAMRTAMGEFQQPLEP